MRRRYSYSLPNAARFFTIYDMLLDMYNNPANGYKPIVVDTTNFGATAYTIQNRVSDGLKWLGENHETVPTDLAPKYGKGDYIQLKLILRSRVMDDNTLELRLLILNTSGKMILAPVDGQTAETVESITKFRIDVEKFLETPYKNGEESTYIKSFRGLTPSNADIQWINSLLSSSPSLMGDWKGKDLTIIKVSK